jgi:hypothetical protein
MNVDDIPCKNLKEAKIVANKLYKEHKENYNPRYGTIFIDLWQDRDGQGQLTDYWSLSKEGKLSKKISMNV